MSVVARAGPRLPATRPTRPQTHLVKHAIAIDVKRLENAGHHGVGRRGRLRVWRHWRAAALRAGLRSVSGAANWCSFVRVCPNAAGRAGAEGWKGCVPWDVRAAAGLFSGVAGSWAAVGPASSPLTPPKTLVPAPTRTAHAKQHALHTNTSGRARVQETKDSAPALVAAAPATVPRRRRGACERFVFLKTGADGRAWPLGRCGPPR